MVGYWDGTCKNHGQNMYICNGTKCAQFYEDSKRLTEQEPTKLFHLLFLIHLLLPNDKCKGIKV